MQALPPRQAPSLAQRHSLALPSAQRVDRRGGATRSNQDGSAARPVFLSIAGCGALPAVAAGPFVAIGIPRPQITMTNSHHFRQLWGCLRRCALGGARMEIPQQHPNTQHRFQLSLPTP